MSLAAAVVVASMPALGGVHLDADAQGRALLTWSGYRGERYVTRARDVTTGREQDLWRADSVSNFELSDVDVAASGAAVACVRVRKEEAQTWRVLIRRRSPQGVWSKPLLVADPKAWVENLTCGIGDAGQVALAWTQLTRSARRSPAWAAAVPADGTVEAPVRLAADAVDDPETVVAPDGTATVAYTVEPNRERVLHLAQRPATGGWTSRPIASAFLPHIVSDGTGRAFVAWQEWSERGQTLQFATSPAFAPAELLRAAEPSLATLVGGPRGDVLAAWQTNASTGRRSRLNVSLQRPRRPFAPPVALGRISAYPVLATLGADGSGAVVWPDGRRRQRVRLLRPDGTWSASIRIPHEAAGLAPAGPGRFALATAQRDRYGSYRVLRLRVLTEG